MNSRWLRVAAVLPPLLLLGIPYLLRAPHPLAHGPVEQLVIITPNNYSIRSEFAAAFAEDYRQKTGREVVIDWRTPGGTSDIINMVKEEFASAFISQYGRFAAEARTFSDAHLDRPGADHASAAYQARHAFLGSSLGIGIDLMFGGGEFDHRVSLADPGYVVDVGLRDDIPELLHDDIIPQSLAGETIYDPKGRYFGTALTAFGICLNRQRLAVCTSGGPELDMRSWSDLGAPELFGAVAMADPSKSGSIAVCYAMMIQDQLAKRLLSLPGPPGPVAPATPTTPTTPTTQMRSAALDAGWQAGFTLIKRIAGNARNVTDSAQRVPRDVALGDAAVGMCIDFYGRSQSEWDRVETGNARALFTIPAQGSAITADPISCFRGAPHPELAKEFMRFVLSRRGQQLWEYRIGEAGGPQHFALRRWSVRRDLYSPEDQRHMSDPLDNPFLIAHASGVPSALTQAHFALIRAEIKAVILDPRSELRDAWQAIIAAGGPQQVPEAYATFTWLPFDYAGIAAAEQALHEDRLLTMRRWCIAAQDRYRQARQLALEKR